MTDKVQKIREEVERLRNLHQMKYQQLDTNDNMSLVECGKRNLCDELLSFIDSLQEEPVSEKKCLFTKDNYTDEDRKVLCEDCDEDCEYAKKVEPAEIDFEQELYNYFGQVKDFTLGMRIAKRFYDMGRKQQENVSEDFEAEWKEYFKYRDDIATVNIKDLAKHFANWQKQQDQSTIELAEDHAMLAGMEKMKEQMMKDAIELEVKKDAGGYPYIDCIELYDYDKDVPLAKEGDKYKVILIKEE